MNINISLVSENTGGSFTVRLGADGTQLETVKPIKGQTTEKATQG